MTVVYPMEVVIMPKTTYILTDYTVSRRIFTDGRDWPKEMDQNFNGLSIGNGSIRAAMAATPRSRSRRAASRGRAPTRPAASASTRTTSGHQGAHLPRPADNNSCSTRSRRRPRADPALDVLKKIQARPRSRPDLDFNDCAENNHHVFIGNDNYFVSEDGFLMPVKKGQQPPDLRYFTPRK